MLAARLGERLEAEGKLGQAMLCHVIGGDIGGLTRTMQAGGEETLGQSELPKHLQDLVSFLSPRRICSYRQKKPCVLLEYVTSHGILSGTSGVAVDAQACRPLRSKR